MTILIAPFGSQNPAVASGATVTNMPSSPAHSAGTLTITRIAVGTLVIETTQPLSPSVFAAPSMSLDHPVYLLAADTAAPPEMSVRATSREAMSPGTLARPQTSVSATRAGSMRAGVTAGAALHLVVEHSTQLSAGALTAARIRLPGGTFSAGVLPDVGTALLFNSATGAASFADSMPLTGIATLGGVTYATTEDGLVSFCGSRDADTLVHLGVRDFGTRQRKALRQIEVTARGGRVGGVSVSADAGYKYRYPLAPLRGGGNLRAVTGRGMLGSSFTIIVSGAGELEQVSALADATSRK